MTNYRPAGLGPAGERLWARIIDAEDGWDLLPDALQILEDACRQADLNDVLSAAVAELDTTDLVVGGSKGQPVVHPLIAELRQGRAALASLLSRITLPEGDGEADSGPAGSVTHLFGVQGG